MIDPRSNSYRSLLSLLVFFESLSVKSDLFFESLAVERSIVNGSCLLLVLKMFEKWGSEIKPNCWDSGRFGIVVGFAVSELEGGGASMLKFKVNVFSRL
jgi:hypothetical protein